MRVICINDKLESNELPYGTFKLVEGNVYTVVREAFAWDKFDFPIGKCYDLLECGRYLYRKDKFIPCSDIDETELIKERQEQSIEAALQEVG